MITNQDWVRVEQSARDIDLFASPLIIRLNDRFLTGVNSREDVAKIIEQYLAKISMNIDYRYFLTEVTCNRYDITKIPRFSPTIYESIEACFEIEEK